MMLDVLCGFLFLVSDDDQRRLPRGIKIVSCDYLMLSARYGTIPYPLVVALALESECHDVRSHNTHRKRCAKLL